GDDPNSPEDPSPRNTQHATRPGTRTRFLEQTGAHYIRLIREGLPINPLYRDPNPTSNAQIAYEIANLIRCFATQFGASQEANFCEAYHRLPAPDSPALADAITAGPDLPAIAKCDRCNH